MSRLPILKHHLEQQPLAWQLSRRAVKLLPPPPPSLWHEIQLIHTCGLWKCWNGTSETHKLNVSAVCRTSSASILSWWLGWLYCNSWSLNSIQIGQWTIRCFTVNSQSAVNPLMNQGDIQQSPALTPEFALTPSCSNKPCNVCLWQLFQLSSFFFFLFFNQNSKCGVRRKRAGDEDREQN